MKVVHINFSLEMGGTETMLVDILNEQCRRADTHLIIINEQFDATLLSQIDSHVTVWRVGRPKGSKNPIYIAKLNILLRRIGSNVIHCHNHQIAQWLWKRREQCCLTVHDVYIPTRYFNRYNKLFAISSIVRQDVLNRSGIVADQIYNGIQTGNIQQKTIYSGQGTFKILQISRLLHQKKGQHILLEAIRQLVHRDGLTQLQIDFVGEGESRAYLEQLTSTYQVNDYVKFLGQKSRSELYSSLKDYHLLIQPSLYEGFGLTVAEAMAAGVPVLVSAIDGPMELIDNDRFGYSFPVGDVAILASQIYKLATSYESPTVKNKAIAARHHAQMHFDVRRTAEQYLASYL